VIVNRFYNFTNRICDKEVILMRPTVVKLKRSKGVVVQDCDVYIGRRQTQGGWVLKESEWCNPFNGKTYGDKAIPLFKEQFLQKIRDEPEKWIPKLVELEGKVLGCWCKPSPCHGDVIADIVEELCKVIENPDDVQAWVDKLYNK